MNEITDRIEKRLDSIRDIYNISEVSHSRSRGAYAATNRTSIELKY